MTTREFAEKIATKTPTPDTGWVYRELILFLIERQKGYSGANEEREHEKLFAHNNGFFWCACTLCDQWFSGREKSASIFITESSGQMVCQDCEVEANRLKKLFPRGLMSAPANVTKETDRTSPGEKLWAECRKTRPTDGGPEGTREALEQCARMLDTYSPDLYPANELGQVDFARAMMDSVADEIRAFLGKSAGEEKVVDAGEKAG